MVRNLLKDKRVILLLSFLALFSLLLLAGTMRGVNFRPAQRFSQEETEIAKIPVGEIVREISEISLRKQIAFLLMLAIFGAMVASLLSPEMRRRLLKQLFRIGISVILIYYLLKRKPDLLQNLLPFLNFGVSPQSDLSLSEEVPPPVFEPPQVSGWLSFFITLGVVLLAALIIWRINRWWTLRSEVSESPSPLDEIAKVARASLHDLSSRQGSAQDKIIQCYEDMSRVVDMRRGLYREYAMTPSEFAERLEKAGLPREAVNRLTRLFESVRYGARTSAQSDVDEAVACLTSIVKFCGETV